jgi:hypothetical protein
MTLSAQPAPAVASVVDAFTHYDKHITIYANGKIVDHYK